MNNDIQVLELTRRNRDINRFMRVSYGIYQDDPWWVAPLMADLKLVFQESNPLFQHAEMTLWVARRGGRDIGRIAGIIDQNHEKQHHDSTAYFGFYECVADREVSRQLFDTVFAWARRKGMRRVVGPLNPTINDECGLLVAGFDSPPVLMMTYNPPYYADQIEAEGFRKAKDLLAFIIDLKQTPMRRFERIADEFGRRQPDITVRPLRRKTLRNDLLKVKEVYNSAWEDNWGFVPMTDPEMDFMAKRLKPLLMEGLVWLAETTTEPVGFLLALPDYNQAIKPLKGRLLTPKLIGFIPYLLGRKWPMQVRLIAFGIKKEFRKRGIESAMLAEGLRFGFKAGFQTCEASWILEENVSIQRIIGLFGGKVYKTYRIYERSL